MKRIVILTVLMISCFSLKAQVIDTTQRRVANPVILRHDAAKPMPVIVQRSSIQCSIFGNYEITNYAILSKHTPSNEELTQLKGSLVKVDTSTITGTAIDPFTFEIYLVERLRRDDFIYRVFGREIKAPEPDLPESFIVHKTDHENLYGIIEIDTNHIALPYQGVLLFLTRK